MDFLFNIPFLPHILGALVLIVIYRALAPHVRLTGVKGMGREQLLAKILGRGYVAAQLDKAVARSKQSGDYLTAGRLYEEADKIDEAITVYTEGKEHHAAGALLERLGRLERAAQAYMQGGDSAKAAALFSQAGRQARAAELFLERGNTLEAARLFGEAEQWLKSGELYLKAGYPKRAAQALEKAGELERAAKAYEHHFTENVTYSTTYSSTASVSDRQSARDAGRLYEQLGELNRAASVYAKGQYFKEAAGACQTAGEFSRAGELLLRAEDLAGAAAVFEQAGDTVQSANLRGELAIQQDRLAEAAAFFQQGGDYLRAAELFESQGLLAEAAAAYEAAESFVAAGGVFLRAGLKDRAAPAFERGGDFETAGKLYEEVGNRNKAMDMFEKAGLTFKSGEAAYETGQAQKAIALLQRVGAEDEHYVAANTLLVQLFIQQGLPGLAVARANKALGDQPISASNLDLYYGLAAATEAAGDKARALAIFSKIQAEDLGFKDVTQRMEALRAGRPSDPAVPPSRAVAPPAATSSRASTGQAPKTIPPATASARFVPREEVGRGPLGALYRAEDRKDARDVALRVLSQELLSVEGALQTLATDLKSASRLRHANLVRVLGLVEIRGQRCVVTEWVAGQNLATVLDRGQRLSLRQSLSLAQLLGQVLVFVHSEGLIHGGLRPSNIMMAAGALRLTDLGLARSRQRFPAPYRAPENILSPSADLYALGAVLYHMLTGVDPTTLQPLPPPGSRVQGLPPALDALLLRTLDAQPERRSASAAEWVAEFDTVCSGG